MSDRDAETVADEHAAPAGVRGKGGFLSYVGSLGPGIVVALSWIGTGDLIDNSVAGGNYGYALLWVLPLSLVFRFVFVNTLARYAIYNAHADPSIVRGFSRIHVSFRWLLLISFVVYTHILMAFTLSGVGTAMEGLTGGTLGTFPWAVIGAVSVFIVTFRGAYWLIENIFKVVLIVMVGTFVVGIAFTGIDWGAFASGIAFRLPPDKGLFGSGLVASSLILATVGSMANLFYPEFLREKGWTTPAHRRIQLYDLAFGTIVVLFLGLAVWVIGAEVLFGQRGVDSADDIAAGLAGAVGPAGNVIFYLGLLAAAWTTVAGSIFALSKMVVESLHVIRPSRGERYEAEPTKDPAYLWTIVWGLLAVVWSLPGAPGFVVLVVVSHVLTSPFLLLIVVALLFMLNSRSAMGRYTNSWVENLGLGLVGIFVAVAAVQGIQGAVETIAGL